MKNLLLILAGLLAIAALAYHCSHRHRGEIEADLGKRTSDSLASLGFGGAKAKAEEQLIVLTGQVPDAAAKAKAESAARAVWGVQGVRNLLTVTPPMTAAKIAAIDCQSRFNDLLKEPILFQTNKAVIAEASHALLDKLAEASKACPAAEIEVGGHTDSRGTAAKNQALSERRAKAVVRYLAGKGVETNRFAAVGYGESNPIASNDTADGMAKNRRTEFKVKGI